MKKLLISTFILLTSLPSASYANEHMISALYQSNKDISYGHKVIQYDIKVKQTHYLNMQIRTNALSIDMNDLSYQRNFNTYDVFALPEFKRKAQAMTKKFESLHNVKIISSYSDPSGPAVFSIRSKNPETSNKLAKEVNNKLSKLANDIGMKHFHHVAIGNQEYFDYALAARNQSTLGEAIYRKSSQLMSRVSAPLNRLQYYLDFVQRIPYSDNNGTSGTHFNTPLAVLMNNQGDCDEKALLLSIILKEAFRDKEVGLILFKNIPHAIAVIESKMPMSNTFYYQGKNYLPLETTTPALYGEITPSVKSEIKSGAFHLMKI